MRSNVSTTLRLLLLSSALVLPFVSCERDANLHVSSSGDNTGDGTQGKPLASIKQAVALAAQAAKQGRIENNVAVDCEKTMVWSDIKNGKQAPSAPYPSAQERHLS